MRACINDSIAIGSDVSAGRASFTRADGPDVGSIAIHREDLIAFVRIPRRLENDSLAVQRKICLCVLTAERELANVTQIGLFRMRLQSLRTADVNTCGDGQCNE